MMSKPRTLFEWLYAASIVLALSAPGRALAHEFWIEPDNFQLQSGDVLSANIRVGESMQGDNLYYLPSHFEQFTLHVGTDAKPVRSRIGDQPAVQKTVQQPSLHILAYVSKNSQLTYREAQKFDQFLAYEGLEWVKSAHQERGLPEAGFSEAYQRFAKSLIQVGNGSGQDRALGLRFELVLLNNPYTQKDQDIRVQLLWEGKPFANAQVNVFKRRNNQVGLQNLHTDTQGIIVIPRHNASGVYLLNAVHMIEPPANMPHVVWKSLWASTTFAVN